jgi:hypothetical protein
MTAAEVAGVLMRVKFVDSFSVLKLIQIAYLWRHVKKPTRSCSCVVTVRIEILDFSISSY